MSAISVRGLVKDYGSLRAVDGIAFTIDEGEIFALLGPNGAGKTTTVGATAVAVRRFRWEAR